MKVFALFVFFPRAWEAGLTSIGRAVFFTPLRRRRETWQCLHDSDSGNLVISLTSVLLLLFLVGVENGHGDVGRKKVGVRMGMEVDEDDSNC